ncbi:MAG: hypothetical protein JWM63_3588 [Gammaproteobacteria bacterium]|jgi:hypothetical protein|nr:hypothetical protein [Gammaproteobacteria bacterium]
MNAVIDEATVDQSTDVEAVQPNEGAECAASAQHRTARDRVLVIGTINRRTICARFRQ